MKTPPFYLIESFVVFAKAENMSAAAEVLGISQPALTYQLKLFEDYFPQDVFTQDGRRKVLTPFGEELQKVLGGRFAGMTEDLEALTGRMNQPEELTVRIAGRGEILNFLAPKLDFPGSLIFTDTDGATAARGVLQRKYTIAITNHLEKADALVAKKIFTDHFCLLAPKSWTGEKKSLSASLIENLMTRPYIAYKEEDAVLERFLSAHKMTLKPRVPKVLSSWPSIIAMVESHQGWTLAPSRYESKAPSFSLGTQGAAVETPFYMLYRKEYARLAWFRNLTEELREVF